VLVSSTQTTLLECWQEVHNQVLRQHGPQCVNCALNNLTVWREDHFTVTKAAGIEERKKRVAEMIAKELTKAKPGAWGCVQTREMWSTDEQIHLRPGHRWLFRFGDGGEGSSCVKTLPVATAEDWGGLQVYTLLQWRSRSQGQEVALPSG